MNDLKKIFNRPKTKTVITSILSTAITVFICLFSMKLNYWLWGILSLSTILVYILTQILYTRSEDSLIIENKQLKEKNEVLNASIEAFDSAIQGITKLCKSSAMSTNTQVHEIIEYGRLDCSNWNFDIACGLVCQVVYTNVIKEICNTKAPSGIIDIDVCFIKNECSNNKKHQFATMSAYYNPFGRCPKIFRKKREIFLKKISNNYYDMQILMNGATSPQVLFDKTDIESRFICNNSHDYSQYIGIPVVCDSDSGGKVVGLLEIVCHNDCVLSEEKSKLVTFIDRFFSPYTQLILLFYKLEKALKAVPKKECNG